MQILEVLTETAKENRAKQEHEVAFWVIEVICDTERAARRIVSAIEEDTDFTEVGSVSVTKHVSALSEIE
jgi:hypothetical protein